MAKKKRKWGSPAQRRALAKMLAAGRKARRGGSTPRKSSSSTGGRTVASTKKKRRSSPSRSKSTSRRGKRGSSRRGSVYIELAKTAAAGVGGFIATQYIVDKFAPVAWKTGDKRIMAKGAASLALYLGGKRVSPVIGRAAAVGGLTSTGLDLVAKFAAKPAGVSGMGSFGPANTQVRTMGDYESQLAQEAAELGIA